ncbi:hypothetical protein HIMB11_03193 [Rhodobacteraceae bacterium HIMB11]|nr:hypothetical protein HIMB11_03193 [Rhodobacteraceae bacterium HIMB11]
MTLRENVMQIREEVRAKYAQQKQQEAAFAPLRTTFATASVFLS